MKTGRRSTDVFDEYNRRHFQRPLPFVSQPQENLRQFKVIMFVRGLNKHLHRSKHWCHVRLTRASERLTDTRTPKISEQYMHLPTTPRPPATVWDSNHLGLHTPKRSRFEGWRSHSICCWNVSKCKSRGVGRGLRRGMFPDRYWGRAHESRMPGFERAHGYQDRRERS